MRTIGSAIARGALAMAGRRSPWGGGKDGGEAGDQTGSGGDNGDADEPAAAPGKSGGPRNPWLPPGDGPTRRSASLEDIFKNREQRGGGGGGGMPRLPQRPGGKSWFPVIVAAIVLLWIGVSTVHMVGPKEQGIVTTFGKYSRTINPGISLSLPWPIQNVDVTDVTSIKRYTIPEGEAEKLMLTSDQNLVDLSYLVRWNIKDLKLFRFRLADPESAVREVAEAAMRASIAEVPLDEALSGAGRGQVEVSVMQRMQQILDNYRSGVRIQGVEIKKADPPTKVIGAFQQVTAAQQDAERDRSNARAWAQQLLARAEGDAAAFDKVYQEYKLAPQVTKRRMYYETMERVLQKNDKVITETEGCKPVPGPPGNAQARTAGRNRARPAGRPVMDGSIFQKYKVAIILAAVAIGIVLSSVVMVGETQQAVVVRFGDPVRKINAFHTDRDFGQTGAGLTLRIPFAERLVRIDKRLLSVDMQQQQVLSTDQLRLNVDAYARFRIIDPVKMVRTAGTPEQVEEQLEPILTSVLRRELGKRTFQSLLTAERGTAMENIRDGLDQQAREYGAQIVDVRIKRADLPNGALESAFSRMQAAREQEATTIRAQGQKQAQIIRAEAEAEAANTYAAAFGKDADFYDFYRAMQSYDFAFSDDDGRTTILLSPDNAYLKKFKSP